MRDPTIETVLTKLGHDDITLLDNTVHVVAIEIQWDFEFKGPSLFHIFDPIYGLYHSNIQPV